MKQIKSQIAFITVLAVSLIASQLQASISIGIAAEKLKDPSGIDSPVTGIVLLIADTDGTGFEGPTETAFVQGDDYIVASWDIAIGGGNDPGAFFGGTGPLDLQGTAAGEWGEGDDLALFWYPSLTAANLPGGATPGPVAAAPYGSFRLADGANTDESEDWVTPLNGVSNYKLIFLTMDATKLAPSGGNSEEEEGDADESTGGTAPVAPTDLAGVATPGQIVLTWTDNATDESGYRIERSLNGTGDWSLVTTTGPSISTYTDISMSASTSYDYRVITIRNGSYSSANDAVGIVSAGEAVRLTNLSNRAFVGTQNDILIGSFVIVDHSLRVYIKIVGASLPSSISNPLLDPTLKLVKLHDEDFTPIINDNWKSDQQALIETIFADYPSFIPADDNEPAMICTLEPGTYSALISGVDDTSGFANFEIYELKDSNESVHGVLSNLSNRALVGTENEILIGSFTVAGEGTQSVYIKIVGASLPSSISNPLLDPELKIVKINDDSFPEIIISSWLDDPTYKADIESSFELYPTFIPADDAEPAVILRGLEPGSYSAVISGAEETTGVANVEIYEMSD